jgi:antitoxin FitA
MSTLTVRKLNDNIYRRLRIRAAREGVSMEEEARRILTRAVSAPLRLSMVFRKHFGEQHGVDLQMRRKPHEPIDLSE